MGGDSHIKSATFGETRCEVLRCLMLFRILLVSSDEMPRRPSKRNNGTCDYRPLGTEECERSLCFFSWALCFYLLSAILLLLLFWAQKSVSARFVFFLGHYASICCRQYSFCFYFGNQRLAMPRRNENTSQASPKKERKKERNSADRETVTLSRLPSEKRDARCYAALCSLGFCLSPQMKCLEGHQREIMGLVVIDHWAQKSVSARFVFFLGHYATICCRQYSFCF